MNEREKYCKKRAREIYKTFICMDNTYGKQTRAFDKLGCALSGHRAYNYGCCPSRLTALFARLPIQPISLPSFAPQSSPPIVNYQSIIDRASKNTRERGGIERLRAVNNFWWWWWCKRRGVNKRGRNVEGDGWSRKTSIDSNSGKEKKKKKRRSKNRIG